MKRSNNKHKNYNESNSKVYEAYQWIVNICEWAINLYYTDGISLWADIECSVGIDVNGKFSTMHNESKEIERNKISLLVAGEIIFKIFTIKYFLVEVIWAPVDIIM